MNIETRVLSSLEKVYPDQAPAACTVPFTFLQNEAFAFQVALCPEMTRVFSKLIVRAEADCQLPVQIKQVRYVPCNLPCMIDDGRYERTKPGLFPDPLQEANADGEFFVPTGRWSSFFIEVTPDGAPAGEYPFTLKLSGTYPMNGNEKIEVTVRTTLQVIGAQLPPSQLRYTCWFHGDCLADYYHVPVFSERHWTIMENQIRLAASRGQNMILIPLFTPPLDTKVGGERTTIQLMDVQVHNGQYSFDFSLLDRWIEMCQRHHIEYFEISHLFTQWGATSCPKIMATVDGEYKQIFGWDNEALSDEYKEFLSAMLPALTHYIDEKGLHDKVYFHISDEPHGEEHLAQYLKLKAFVSPLLEGFIIMDALSDYSFYQQGVCEYPVIATTALDPFLEGQRPKEFWVYYCVSQGHRHVSNRFFSMPGYRTRILGLQCYKENVNGFLHWGLNFYNSQYSIRHIDPYKETDADCSFPGGDGFIIYPGENDEPVESQRLVIFHEAIQDIQALRLLESLTSREHVLALMDEDASEPVSFFTYPTGEQYLLRLRYKVNQEIQQHLS